MRYIYKIVLCLAVLYSVSSDAQQNSQYTQYMYNTIIINPGYTGSRDNLSLSLLYRSQWVGLDGAPRTGNFSIHSPIGGSNLALGLSLISDKIGPSNETTFKANFSYTIDTSPDNKLAFGVNAGGNFLNIDFNKLGVYNPGDPALQTNINNQFSPNFGAGIYYYSDKWYLGASVPNILETDHYDDSQVSIARESVHLYLIAGYVFDFSETLKFKPAIMAKGVRGAPIALDLSANFMFYDKFTLGVAYRYDVAFSGLVGFQVSEKLMLGFAYDYDTTELGNYNSGSYEFMLRYDFIPLAKRYISPRFF